MSVAIKEPRAFPARRDAEKPIPLTPTSHDVQVRSACGGHHNLPPTLPGRRGAERPQVHARDDGYEITVSTRPCPRLPECCFDALAAAGLRLRSLSITWDQDRAGWQRLTIVTRSGSPDAAVQVAQLLACAA